MQDQALLESVSELVTLAGSGINEALASLPDEADDDQLSAAIEACLAGVETVAMAAEVAQMSGLRQLCDAVNETLGTLNGHRRAFQTFLKPRLCGWSEAVQLYIRQPDADGITESLLALTPSAQRDALRLKLMGSKPELSTTGPVPAEESVGIEASAEDFEVAEGEAFDDAGGVLAGESPDENEPGGEPGGEPGSEFDSAADTVLGEVSAEWQSWCAILCSPEPSPEALQAACAGCGEAVGRIRAAGMALGLSGFGAVCESLQKNIQELTDADLAVRSEAGMQLMDWPAIAGRYLQAPEEEGNQLVVFEWLLSSSWSEPPTEAQVEELIVALVPNQDEYPGTAELRPVVAQPEDIALDIDPDVNPRLVEVFLQETPANAASFSAGLERVIRGEEIGRNLAHTQRLAHNLKGSANLIGVKGIANLTHHIEDILEYLSEHQQMPSAALSNTLQEAADCIETMLDAVCGAADAPADAQRILQDVLDWAHRMDAGQLDTPVEAVAAMAESEAVTGHTLSAAEAGSSAVAAWQSETASIADVEPPPADAAVPVAKVVRVPVDTIDGLFRLVGEVSISLDQLQERFDLLRRLSNEVRNQDNLVQQRRFELENFIDVRHVANNQQRLRQLSQGQDFDPLEMDQYDELYSTTRSFIEAVVDSRRMAQSMRSELATLERSLTPLRRMKSDLQQVVMQTRMEPVSSIIARLQRSVRQAVRITGKQADLVIAGGGIQLDSEVLGRLAEPLMHMLRNAVDHGIETPAERIARGKSETGTISLRFSQEGQNVVIRCTDDGRGLDYARIQAIAVEKGLLTGSTNVGKETLARLIMTPGFSTRSDTTQLSGRGIGMDVVQTTIRELQGIIEIGDGESGGCRISLRLPITLLTSHSLVVRVGSERYAIPSSSIMQVVSPQQGRFTMIGNRLAYELGRDTYPVTALSACLQPHGDAGRPAANSSIVMIYSDAGPVAVAVDQLINNYSIIVKSPGRYVGPIRGVVGLSSLADGSLIPVLDVAELLRAPVRARSVPTATATMTAPAQPPQAVVRIMIVDDSISVRQTLSDLVADAGYEALVARDGLEAVDLLRQLTPDLVLTDIEMPRMNGLELVSYIRTSHSTELPVIVITSRTMQKHRQQAAEAGANSYISKPFDEDELLTLIRSLLE